MRMPTRSKRWSSVSYRNCAAITSILQKGKERPTANFATEPYCPRMEPILLANSLITLPTPQIERFLLPLGDGHRTKPPGGPG